MRDSIKFLKKISLVFGFCLAIGFGVVYIFILPPKVIAVYPAPESQDVGLNSQLVIKFNKPVKRQKLEHDISPSAYGEWRFEDPLIKNHLFRTLVFTPAVDFKPNTYYQVEVKNIFSFGFKTQASVPEVSEVKIESKQAEPKVTFLNVALDWQDYPLSCEAASLKMALASKGIFVSEDQIMEKIGYDLTPHKGNIWGDPYYGYVGKIDGEICFSGFGVFWEPVAKAANTWRQSEFFSDWGLKDLTREIEAGNPMIVWGVLPLKSLTDCSWYTSQGKYIKVYKQTHVRLVVGFIGETGNPLKIILNDPLAGQLYWSVEQFLTNWSAFNYSGVVVR